MHAAVSLKVGFLFARAYKSLLPFFKRNKICRLYTATLHLRAHVKTSRWGEGWPSLYVETETSPLHLLFTHFSPLSLCPGPFVIIIFPIFPFFSPIKSFFVDDDDSNYDNDDEVRGAGEKNNNNQRRISQKTSMNCVVKGREKENSKWPTFS